MRYRQPPWSVALVARLIMRSDRLTNWLGQLSRHITYMATVGVVPWLWDDLDAPLPPDGGGITSARGVEATSMPGSDHSPRNQGQAPR